MIVLNLGGEGEVAGAINLNSLVATMRPLSQIRAAGALIQGDFTRMPIADGVVDAIVGNRMPLQGYAAQAVASESFRVLKSGGWFRGYASTGGGSVLLVPLSNAGFEDVGIVAGYARGRKP
jgi:ubiquinone/menaquinone biosynthesis C-methylase UbiE